MLVKKHQAAFAISMLVGVFASHDAQAGPYVPIANPVLPIAGKHIPPPNRVPGKEYSHELDRSSTAAGGVVLDDQQNTMWDGSGGVDDTFDYNDGPGIPGGTSNNPNDQVDAIANNGDALFFEAVNNQSAVLFSTRDGPNIQGAGVDVGAPAQGCGAGDPVCSESIGGGIATWATWAQVDQHGGTNLDGLEVWGQEGVDDADRFSLFNDFANGCSVFAGTGPGSGCFVPQALIAGLFTSLPSDLVDIDALMVNGDWLMFSLWPIAGTPEAVGDSVWVWQIGAPAAAPLSHGGHLWTNNWLGLNVDALEAVSVPEPGSLALISLGALGFARPRRRHAS